MKIDVTTTVWDGEEMQPHSVTLPTRDDSTVVEVIAAGVCGTDLHVMQHTKMATAQAPIGLGHEILGRVLRCGRDLPVVGGGSVEEGDIVVVVPGAACGRCPMCMSFGSHEHLCPHRTVHGFSTFRPDGRFAIGGYSTHLELADDITVARVPDGLGWRRAVLAELVSIAVRATERGLGQGRPDLGMGTLVAGSVAVIGAGPVGTAVSLTMRAVGMRVTTFETNPWRAEYASRELGLDVRLVSDGDTDWARDAVADTTAQLGFDLVVECAGSAEAFADSLTLARAGGRVVELGNFISAGSAPVDPSVICRKDLEVVGSVLAPPAAYPKALALLERADLPFDRLVSETFTLDQATAAYLTGERTHMKRVMVGGEHNVAS